MWQGFFLVQSKEVWRRASPSFQHQSMASPLAHPASFSTHFTCGPPFPGIGFSLIHILSVLNIIHAAHFSSWKNSSKKCIVLDSPPKHFCTLLMCAKCHCLGESGTGSQTHTYFPTPSTWHYGESYTPAKLQAAHLMDFSLKNKQTNKWKTTPQTNLHIDSLNRVSDKHSCKWGKERQMRPLLSTACLTAEYMGCTSFKQTHELSEVKTERIHRKQDERADEHFSP